jgi:hypothetical protein
MGRVWTNDLRLEETAVRFEASRSFADVANLLAVINRPGGVRCYRPAVLMSSKPLPRIQRVPMRVSLSRPKNLPSTATETNYDMSYLRGANLATLDDTEM